MIQFPYFAVATSRGSVMFRTVGAPIVGITQDAIKLLAQEEFDKAEWLELESEHIRCPHSGYLIPKPSRVSRGIMTWTGIGCGNRAKPNYPAAIARYEKKRGR